MRALPAADADLSARSSCQRRPNPTEKNVRTHHQHTKPTQAPPLDQDGGAETDQPTARPREGRLGDELGDGQQVHTQLTLLLFLFLKIYIRIICILPPRGRARGARAAGAMRTELTKFNYY